MQLYLDAKLYFSVRHDFKHRPNDRETVLDRYRPRNQLKLNGDGITFI